MINGNKLIVVMPAFNAEHTLRQTFADIPHEYVDDVILVDDVSNDATVKLAKELGIKTIVHTENTGYGGNQKTCYRAALALNADIIVMVHPDYQYSPRIVTALASMIASRHYDIVLGSRILGGTALKGGMPLYKYIANRFLTLSQNIILKVKLSEYHTGFRAFRREVLETLPLEENSDDFIFDNEILLQAIYFGYRIGEVSCPTRYFAEASSINFNKSVNYGLGVLVATIKYCLQRYSIAHFSIYSRHGRKLNTGWEFKTIAK